MLKQISGVVFCICLVAGVTFADESKQLQGTWRPVSAVLSGQPFPDAILKQMKLEIGEGTYTVPIGKVVDKGTWKIDSTANPKTLDLTGTEGPNQGKTIVAIYKFEGDKLVVCYNLVGKDYPSTFESKANTGTMLSTYQRSQP